MVGRKPPGGGLGRWWCGFVGGGARRDGRDQLMDGWIDVSEWMGLSEMNEAGRRHKEHMRGFLSRRRIKVEDHVRPTPGVPGQSIYGQPLRAD